MSVVVSPSTTRMSASLAGSRVPTISERPIAPATSLVAAWNGDEKGSEGWFIAETVLLLER